MLELETRAREENATVAGLLASARVAQEEWAKVPMTQRLRCLRTLRDILSRDARELTKGFSEELPRTPADSVMAEILPLAEAARFLERNAERLIRPRWLNSRDRPIWLRKVRIQLRPEPLGTVLIIGPSNYPLFLPGVQALQALVAGNAVLLKPGSGGRAVALALQHMAVEAGIPAELFSVLDERVESATAALRAGVDKVIMTGSATSARAVLREAAEQITPVVAELSGCDAVFVREDADIAKTVAAVVFGMMLNGGATCIAPRRVFVNRTIADEFEHALAERVGALRPLKVSRSAAFFAETAIREATLDGARVLNGSSGFFCEAFPPTVLFDVRTEMAVMQSDLFVPLVSVMPVDSDDEALQAAKLCPYSLGATVFGEEQSAKRFAARVHAGVVVVNDMIVPTADPRLPFGGSGRSGFGKTRGAEGLLEMTHLKAIIVQRAKRLRHLEPPHAKAEELFLLFLAARHRIGWRDRLRAWRRLGRVVTRNNS